MFALDCKSIIDVHVKNMVVVRMKLIFLLFIRLLSGKIVTKLTKSVFLSHDP